MSKVRSVDTNDPVAFARFCSEWDAASARDQVLTDEEVLAIFAAIPDEIPPHKNAVKWGRDDDSSAA